MMPLSVSVCILTYQRCALLRELLRELTEITVPIEIVLVDNHSLDDTQAMVETEFSEVVYIRTDSNIGAAARNVGMRAARNEIVVTLDDDIKGLQARSIERIARVFSDDPTLGALNFRVTDPLGRTCNWVHHCRPEEFADKNFLTYEITEGAVAFRKSVLADCGYYPQAFFLSHEGPDLAFRIMDAGYQVRYDGNIVVTHSFAEQGRQPWRNYYYDTRNQLWLAARNFPLWYAIVYLARGLSTMLLYSIRDGYFLYWLKAIRDGLSGLKGALRERRALSNTTIEMVRAINRQRPSLVYMIKNRLLTKNVVHLK